MLQKLWGFAQTRYIIFNPTFLPELRTFTYRHVKKFINNNSAIYSLENGQTFRCPGGAILWQGQLAAIDN